MSIRQEKYSGMIMQHLADIFKHKASMFKNVFITISNVNVSPDLSHAKVYLSILSEKDRKEVMELANLHNREIRKELAQKIRKQVRIIPELHFFIDESLDYVFHMEDVFNKIHKDEDKNTDENK